MSTDKGERTLTAIKLGCCFIGCGETAVYAFWTPPDPYDVNYACDEHLGNVLGVENRGRPHEVWTLIGGYDPQQCSIDELRDVGALPVVVDKAADADWANERYGDRYGVDWAYPNDEDQHGHVMAARS